MNKLLYIHTAGSSCIDLGIKCKSTLKVRIGLQMDQYTGMTIFGYYNTDYDTFRFFNYSGIFYLDFGNSKGGRIYGGTFSLNKRYNLEIGNHYVKDLDIDTTYCQGGEVSAFEYATNLSLFMNDSACKGYVYYMQVYDGDTLIFDGIPAQDGDSIGLWDNVSSTMFANTGSGALTAGPVADDYASVEDIVSSIDRARQIRTNSRMDDGSDNMLGADWFTYNGAAVEEIYLNGNSYIGFGSDAADLKVNNRDDAMWNTWREEGMLNGVRFLRVRWGGYASYNTQYDEYKQTFDVLMFETGDICLYMVDIPTSNNTGIYSLGDTTYTAPTAENRWVSFYKTDTGFDVKYEPISFVIVNTKYLVRDGETIYTIVGGELSEVTGELTSELFKASGIDDVPDGALLIGLTAPEVLCWTDKDTAPELTATVQGVPIGDHSVISDNIRVGHESIYGITSVDVTASDGATFLLSFDGGAWMIYTDGTWSASDTGMTGAELAAIPAEAWSSVINSAQYMQLKATIAGVETVTQVVFNFNNESPTAQESEV